MLKLNDEKTVVLVIFIPFFTDRLHETNRKIGEASVGASESVPRLWNALLESIISYKSVCAF